MERIATKSRILLFFFICGCEGGYFAHRNHTRRSFYRYFKEQSNKQSVTTVPPISSSRLTTLNALDVRTTAAVTTVKPTQETTDNGILLLPDDMRPPGLLDATDDPDWDATENAYDATGADDYMDSLLSSEEHGADVREDATGGGDADGAGDALSMGSRPGLFNWQRGMTASLSNPRLGQVGQGTRAVSFRRQRGQKRRQRIRSGLPGVKYMVYTGELNNKNPAKNGN